MNENNNVKPNTPNPAQNVQPGFSANNTNNNPFNNGNVSANAPVPPSVATPDPGAGNPFNIQPAGTQQQQDPMASLPAAWATVKQGLQSKGMSEDDINAAQVKFRTDYTNAVNQSNFDQQSTPEKVMMSILQPLWQNTLGPGVASVVKAVQSVGSLPGLIMGKGEQTDFQSPVNFGPLGYTEPISAPTNKSELMNSYGLAAKFSSLPVSVVTGGASAEATGPTGFWKTAVKGLMSSAKTAAPFSILQGLGEGMQGSGRGSTPTGAAAEGAVSTAENMAGMMMFDGVAKAIGLVGTKMLANPLANKVAGVITDTLNKTMNLTQDVAGKTNSYITSMLKDRYNVSHGLLSTFLRDTFKEPINANELLSGFQKSVGDITKAYADRKNTLYGSFINKETMIPEAKGMASAWDTAYNVAKENLGLQDNGTIVGKIGALSRSQSSLARNLVDTADRIFNDDGTLKPVSTKTLDDLYMRGQGTMTDEENRVWKGVSTSGYGDMRAAFDSSEDPAMKALGPMVDAAKQANDQFQQGLLKGFGAKAKNAYDAMQLISNMSSGKLENKLQVKNIWDALSPSERDSYGKMLYNTALDYSEGMSRNLNDGGAWLSNFVDNWAKEGVFTPEQVAHMDSFSNVLNGDFNSFRNNLSSMVKPEAMGEVTSKLGAAEKGQIAADLQKSLGNEPAFTKVGNKYDFSNLQSALEKTNVDGRNDLLINNIKTYDALKSHNRAAFKGIVETAIGTSMFGGHPMIGAGLILQGASKLGGGTGKSLAISDIPKVADTLIKDGLTSDTLVKILSGNFEPLTQALGAGKAASGLTLENYINTAAKMMGHQPSEQERQQLTNQFNESQQQ